MEAADEEIPDLNLVFETDALDEAIVALARSECGSLFAVGTHDDDIIIYDGRTGRLKDVLEGARSFLMQSIRKDVLLRTHAIAGCAVHIASFASRVAITSYCTR